jgi:hypothetical protein
MSTDIEVWTRTQVGVQALLPVPSRWQPRTGADYVCWWFDGERWLVTVCEPEPVDPGDIPAQVAQLLPGARYLISIGLEPINPSPAAWRFLNRVITALATGSHGLSFDVFTGEPIR